jgi:hypothetical protein
LGEIQIVEIICPFCSVKILSTEDADKMVSDFHECPNCHKIVDIQSLKKAKEEESVEKFINLDNLERSQRMRNIFFVFGIAAIVVGIIGFWIYYLSTH